MKSLCRHLLFGIVGLACTACIWPEFLIQNDYHNDNNGPQLQNDYHNGPQPAKDEELKDDRLEDKPEVFDPTVVDRRPLDGWLVNASAAVTKLDIVAVKPDKEAEFLKLHASYAAALKAAAGKTDGRTILPSVNLIDGKAKQFDDGLYAALDLAYYHGRLGKLRGHVDLVRRLYEKLDRKSEAAAFVAAGLSLAGIKVEADKGAKDRYLRQFLANEVASKPVSFYAENEELSKCFRFLRFFMQQFAIENRIPLELTAVVVGNNSIPIQLGSVLAGDAELRADYQRAVDFYGKLSNPPRCWSLTNMATVQRDPRIIQETVAFFPPSGTREQVLFEKLFPLGWPSSADLMGELIRKIRSGDVKLAPAADSGWYEYQVHALETLLLPEKGEEKRALAADSDLQETHAGGVQGSHYPKAGNACTSDFAVGDGLYRRPASSSAEEHPATAARRTESDFLPAHCPSLRLSRQFPRIGDRQGRARKLVHTVEHGIGTSAQFRHDEPGKSGTGKPLLGIASHEGPVLRPVPGQLGGHRQQAGLPADRAGGRSSAATKRPLPISKRP